MNNKKEISKRYYKKHKEKILKKSKEYYYRTKYYEKNKDKLKLQAKRNYISKNYGITRLNILDDLYFNELISKIKKEIILELELRILLSKVCIPFKRIFTFN